MSNETLTTVASLVAYTTTTEFIILTSTATARVEPVTATGPTLAAVHKQTCLIDVETPIYIVWAAATFVSLIAVVCTIHTAYKFMQFRSTISDIEKSVVELLDEVLLPMGICNIIGQNKVSNYQINQQYNSSLKIRTKEKRYPEDVTHPCSNLELYYDDFGLSSRRGKRSVLKSLAVMEESAPAFAAKSKEGSKEPLLKTPTVQTPNNVLTTMKTASVEISAPKTMAGTQEDTKDESKSSRRKKNKKPMKTPSAENLASSAPKKIPPTSETADEQKEKKELNESSNRSKSQSSVISKGKKKKKDKKKKKKKKVAHFKKRGHPAWKVLCILFSVLSIGCMLGALVTTALMVLT